MGQKGQEEPQGPRLRVHHDPDETRPPAHGLPRLRPAPSGKPRGLSTLRVLAMGEFAYGDVPCSLQLMPTDGDNEHARVRIVRKDTGREILLARLTQSTPADLLKLGLGGRQKAAFLELEIPKGVEADKRIADAGEILSRHMITAFVPDGFGLFLGRVGRMDATRGFVVDESLSDEILKKRLGEDAGTTDSEPKWWKIVPDRGGRAG